MSIYPATASRVICFSCVLVFQLIVIVGCIIIKSPLCASFLLYLFHSILFFLFYSFGILLLQQFNFLRAIMKVSFDLISSFSLFSLQVSAAFFCFAQGWAAVQCRFRAHTRCVLRSSHDAGFLPDKARVLAGRLNDPLRKFFYNSNRVQQSKM